MDTDRFDDLTRSLAAPASRRRALKLFGGGALGAALGLLGRGEARAYPNTCRRFVLSGGRRPDQGIYVDDDLEVRLNGVPILLDENALSDTHPPITFRARAGNRLRIIATDAEPFCHHLDNLYLHCRTGGAPRRLSNEISGCPDVAVGKFFDKTFTI